MVRVPTRRWWYDSTTARSVFEFLHVERNQNCYLIFIMLMYNISYYFGEPFISWWNGKTDWGFKKIPSNYHSLLSHGWRCDILVIAYKKFCSISIGYNMWLSFIWRSKKNLSYIYFQIKSSNFWISGSQHWLWWRHWGEGGMRSNLIPMLLL